MLLAGAVAVGRVLVVVGAVVVRRGAQCHDLRFESVVSFSSGLFTFGCVEDD